MLFKFGQFDTGQIHRSPLGVVRVFGVAENLQIDIPCILQASKTSVAIWSIRPMARASAAASEAQQSGVRWKRLLARFIVLQRNR